MLTRGMALGTIRKLCKNCVMPVERKGRNGGTLKSQAPGDPPLPGGGRPKKLPALDELLDDILGSDPDDSEARSEAKEVLRKLVAAAKKGNVHAQIAVLDRAYGKPRQAHEHTGKGGGAIEVRNLLINLPDDGDDE